MQGRRSTQHCCAGLASRRRALASPAEISAEARRCRAAPRKVTNNLDEEDMPDLKVKIVVGFRRHHLCVAERRQAAYLF